MNAVDMAKRAYGAASNPVRTPRNTEYVLFADITKRIRSAAATRPSDFVAITRALYDNRRLWSVLAAGVADGDNGLPDALRGRIFYLAEFVNHHSRKVLRGEGSIDPLIEINTAVMRGLGRERSPE